MKSLIGKIYFLFNFSPRVERIWKIAHIDFKKRYYDTTFGLIWALLNPISQIIIYYFVFTVFFPRPVENFALYLFSGLISWMFFQECANKCMKTLGQKKYLLDSIQFNKLDLFYSAGISTLMGFVFNILAYLIIALIIGVSYSWSLLLLPVIIINILIVGMSTGIILATINIYFKDISHFWNMIALLGFWTCPIFFRGQSILEKAPIILYLNPMSGIILNSRSFLLDASNPIWYWLIYDLAFGVVLYFVSITIFKKFAHKAVEYI